MWKNTNFSGYPLRVVAPTVVINPSENSHKSLISQKLQTIGRIFVADS